MSALDRLAAMIATTSSINDKSLSIDHGIDAVLRKLERYIRTGSQVNVPHDLQFQAVRRFWDLQKFDNLKDARLVSFGLGIPLRPSGPCIMDDRGRFRAVIDRRTGVDQWLEKPCWYRRCFQGLVRSYFTYDIESKGATTIGKQNWGDLRDYLKNRVDNIVDQKVNPDWVVSATNHRQLFGINPCTPYAVAVLEGDTAVVDLLCEQLGIIKASWFLRELVLAQIRQATGLSHETFRQLLPRLLQMLASNLLLRDRGLMLLLDRYVRIPQHALHPALRNASVEWWGNPWLPSNEMRWGGVNSEARMMVADWLKREFIEAFFTKLAQDGVGDRRRVNFWLRYAKSMDNIQFALGSRAFFSTDKDFVVLRKKMQGLITQLADGLADNNAFIMTIGDLVAVEFGTKGNAFYGYDARRARPFDLSNPARTAKNARNSLKHDQCLLKMPHKDGIHGWDCWEQMFEATLRHEFGIIPNTTGPTIDTYYQQPPQRQSASSVLPYSRSQLESFAHAQGLRVEDFSDRNGNLWIRTNDSNLQVNKVLLEWGFRYKAGKGWWR